MGWRSGSGAGVCSSGVNGGVNVGLMRFGGGGEAGRLLVVDGGLSG